MSLEKMGQSIESNEVKVRLQATPEDVEKVKKSIEYSQHLTKANDVLKVLDFPDNQEEAFRKILLRQDDTTLEELALKSKKEILIFLNRNQDEDKVLEVQKQEKNNQDKSIEDKKNEQKLSKIKSVFTPKILEKNPDIAEKFSSLDWKTSEEKNEILQGILQILKQPWKLKSIIDEMWWADKNNPEYLEFKNALLWVDTSFETYFKDLESINSWVSINTAEIVKWIEKESWWTLEIDLNSKTPMSKMSLIWSQYSFDEEIDKKALSEVMWKGEKELMEVQNSFAVLKGLYKPFDGLLVSARDNWWKPNMKEKINESVVGFSKGLFDELDDMYKKMNIKDDIQIKESDISSFANINSVDELRLKITNVKDKLEKIKAHIQEVQTLVLNKYQTEVKDLLSRNAEAKERQLEVLNFMRSSGFDLIPKEISDKLIREMQGETLHIPWLDMNAKNIDLKNGNFGESSSHKDEWLNIHSKTNMVKFMNKLLGGDVNKPLPVESIANWNSNVDPSSMQSKFIEAWVVDSVGWRYGKITENLTKASVEKRA